MFTHLQVSQVGS